MRIHYRRTIPGALRRPPAAAPASSPPLRQLRGDCVQVCVDPGCPGAHRFLVSPVVRIKTTGSFRQPVTLLRCPPAPRNPLNELLVTPAQPLGLRGPEDAPEQALVLDDHVDGRGGPRLSRRLPHGASVPTGRPAGLRPHRRVRLDAVAQ